MKSDIKIYRLSLVNFSIGFLVAGDFRCFTLGLQYIDNKQSISDIPQGVYTYQISESPKTKKPVIWIENVPGRTAIQIHPGNYTYQLKGCTLVGDSIKFLDNDNIPDITNSTKTMERLIKAIPQAGVIEYL